MGTSAGNVVICEKMDDSFASPRVLERTQLSLSGLLQVLSTFSVILSVKTNSILPDNIVLI